MTQKIKQNLKCLYDTVSLRHRFYRVAQINCVSIWHSKSMASLYDTANQWRLYMTQRRLYMTQQRKHDTATSLYDTTEKTNLGVSIWHKI